MVVLASCKKEPLQKTYAYSDPCSDWKGTWASIGGDSVFSDSLVLNVARFERDTVYCSSNILVLKNYVKHKCPYVWTDENIEISARGKKYRFRPFH